MVTPPHPELTTRLHALRANHILWLAVVTLAELVELVQDGPAPPTAAARLALAICFRHSKGDREPFDDFWR